jgi:hypothetical protein
VHSSCISRVVPFRHAIHTFVAVRGENPAAYYTQGETLMTKRTMFATAAAAFAVVTYATAASAVVCSGANACKGQSACKTAKSSCKGQNACKGKGFVTTGSTIECTAIKAH